MEQVIREQLLHMLENNSKQDVQGQLVGSLFEEEDEEPDKKKSKGK